MQKNYWLKGGLITLGLYVFFGCLLAFYELQLIPQHSMSGLVTMIYLLSPGIFVFKGQALLSFLSSVAFYFVIGSLLEFSYQKQRAMTLSVIALIIILGIITGYFYLTVGKRVDQKMANDPSVIKISE